MATVAARGSGTPVTSGTTWTTTTNIYDGAVGTNPATNAQWASTTSGATGYIESTGHHTAFAAIPAGSTINSVTFNVRHAVSQATRMASGFAQVYDGATTIGAQSALTVNTTTALTNTFTRTPTLAQLKSSTFKIRVSFTRAAVTQACNGLVDYVDVTVDYTEPPPPITQAAYRFYAEGGESGSVALVAENTAPSINVVSDVNVQLRLRMQAGAAVVPNTSDFNLQVNKNGFGFGSSYSDPRILTTYPFSQYSSWIGVANAAGQSFTGNGEQLSRMAFDIHKLGAPPGSYTAALYAHSGTFGTSSVGTGAALATSTTSILGTDLVSGFGWVFFDFNETFTLVNGTNYVMALVRGTAGDASNQVEIVYDASAPTRPGNACTFNGSTWTAVPTSDYMTRVYTKATTPPIMAVGHYSPAMYGSTTAMVEEQPTTQRLTAGTGSFEAAGNQSCVGTCYGIGWTANNYIELLYGITLKAADLANGDSLTFRVLYSGITTNMTYTVTPTINVIKAVPAITQAAYRFYDDTGNEATSPPLQAQDTAHTGNLASGDGLGQFRVRLQSTTAVDVLATDDFTLQWEKNTSGTWNNVPSGAVIGYDSPTLTEAGATTSRLTGGTGSFVAGKVAEDGLVDNLGWTGNNFTELVFSVKFVKEQLANNDVIKFRVVRNGSTATMTYAVTPQVTLTIPPPVDLVVDNCSHSHLSQQPAEHYLTPTTGTASTPDPGVVPNGYAISFKTRGPISTTSSSHQIATQNGSASTRSFQLSRQGTGSLFFQGSNTGAYPFAYMGMSVPGFSYVGRAVPQTLCLAGTYNPSNFATYESGNDGVTWTNLGGTGVSAHPGPFDSPDPVIIGMDGDGSAKFDDRIYWVELRSGTTPNGGTVLWRFDARDHVSGTSWVGAVDGRTWTLTSAAAVTHQPAAADITIVQVPAVNLVVQNAQHSFVNQTDFTKFLATAVGRASTPDPGPLPATGYVFVTKFRGPANTSASSLGIVSQNDVEPNRAFSVKRRGNDSAFFVHHFTAGTNASSVQVIGTSTPGTKDDVNPEYVALAYNATTGAWRALESTNGGIGYTQVGSGTATTAASFDSSDVVKIGTSSTGGADIWDDRIWWVELRTGNDPQAGTLLWRFDANEHVSGTGWTDARGNVWTLTSAAAIVTPTTNTPTLTEVLAPVTLVIADGLHAHIAGMPGVGVANAVRFDNSADRYSRVADALSGSAFTMACWTYMVTDLNAPSYWLSVDDGGGNWNSFGTFADGTQQRWTGTSGQLGGPQLTPGTWYYQAVTYDPAGIDTMYLSNAGAAFSSVTGTITGIVSNAFTFYIGTTGYVQPFDGRIAQVKIWSAVLSQAELEAEMPLDGVARTANLWAYYSFRNGPQTNDESSNGRTLTAAGTLTTEGGPIGGSGVGDIVLTQEYVLTVQSAAHAHTAANVALGVDLVVANAAHAHIADNITVTETLPAVNLVVADGLHAHIATNVALDVVLVVAGAVHAHTADNVTLNYVVLAPVNAAHAHTATNVAVDVVLIPASAAHAQAADNVTLNYVVLAPASAAHAHAADNVALGVDLVVQGAVHVQIADNVGVTTEGALAPNDAILAHTATNVDLTQLHLLTADNAVHVHAADSVTLYPVPNLVVAAGAHAHTAANVAVDVVLVVANAAHAHSAANVTVGVDPAVQNAAHAHNADNIALYPVPNLVVAAGVHVHTASSPTLVVDPAVQSAAHALTSTDVIITPGLLVDSAQHLVTSDEVSLSGATLLTVQPGIHAHTAGNVAPLGVSLVVQSATHVLTSSDVGLSVVLAVQNTAHTVISTDVIVTPRLFVDAALHSHTADLVVLVVDLAVQSAQHAVISDSPKLVENINLEIDAAVHDQIAAFVALELVLVVATAMHALSSDDVDLRGATVLNDALALFLGTQAVSAVYLGATKVWP